MKKGLFNYTIIIHLLCCFTFNAVAEQLHFSKKKLADSYQFNYQWLDHQNTQQTISFTLSKDALFNRFRNFRAYKPEFAKKAIFQAIKKQWQQSPIDDIQVNFPQSKAYNNISIVGNDPQKVQQAYDKLNQLNKKCTATYLTETYYQTFTTHDQITGIKPDHVVIANASVADLKIIKPLILEKVSIKNIRKVTNYVLAFIQSIPYSPLVSRVSSSGAGFNTPLKLLWENQGDCDSKVTLTASLLRALMPRIAMVLVFVDQHAFIGIAIPPIGEEITIEENGVIFVLAEPTGPALLPLGELAPSSEQAIYNGHYMTQRY
ncbi:MAG: hypothetical protein MJK12_12535 [Colwellia sp.]|nr:hypothetical protein [Colwellia sp.]